MVIDGTGWPIVFLGDQWPKPADGTQGAFKQVLRIMKYDFIRIIRHLRGQASWSEDVALPN